MPDSHLESLYQEAQAAIKARDYEYACELLKRILAVDEDYKDTSRLLARAVRLRKRRWYNDPRLWGALGVMVMFILGFVIAPRIGGILANAAPVPTASLTPTQIPTSATTPPLPTPTPDPRILNPENQHLYLYVHLEGATWHLARDHCASLGGHLVTIENSSENTFVYRLADDSIPITGRLFYQPLSWLGATDEANEGDWSWVTGEPWDYSNWRQGEPTNCNTSDCDFEDYLIFSDTGSGTWEDDKKRLYGFICEWESASP